MIRNQRAIFLSIFGIGSKSIVISSLIISSLIIFYPNYSYSYVGFNYNLEEKNNNAELVNKIIEPSINYASLKNEIDIDIDNDDIDIDTSNNFHKDRHYKNFHFDYDDDIDIDDINNHDVIFLNDYS